GFNEMVEVLGQQIAIRRGNDGHAGGEILENLHAVAVAVVSVSDAIRNDAHIEMREISRNFGGAFHAKKMDVLPLLERLRDLRLVALADDDQAPVGSFFRERLDQFKIKPSRQRADV